MLTLSVSSNRVEPFDLVVFNRVEPFGFVCVDRVRPVFRSVDCSRVDRIGLSVIIVLSQSLCR